jgi:hypothetical protein
VLFRSRSKPLPRFAGPMGLTSRRYSALSPRGIRRPPCSAAEGLLACPRAGAALNRAALALLSCPLMDAQRRTGPGACPRPGYSFAYRLRRFYRALTRALRPKDAQSAAVFRGREDQNLCPGFRRGCLPPLLPQISGRTVRPVSNGGLRAYTLPAAKIAAGRGLFYPAMALRAMRRLKRVAGHLSGL